MYYFIGIAIAIAVLVTMFFVGKILVIVFVKKFAAALVKKAVNNTTRYAKDQIQTMIESKEEKSKE
jgi:Holliday junction resolvasome RuvABC endonuclease subunit